MRGCILTDTYTFSYLGNIRKKNLLTQRIGNMGVCQDGKSHHNVGELRKAINIGEGDV